MSYGTYSEVYFAIDFDDKRNIKIGETTNARRRGRQLAEQGYTIVKTLNVNESYAARLFVESYVRARIEMAGRVTRIRTDYFVCDSEAVSDFLFIKFQEWVTEADRLLRSMGNASTTILISQTENKPPVPLGQEEFYHEIFKALDTFNVWEDHWQCGTRKAEETKKELNDAFVPFGYYCSYSQNCSWCYFKIEKKLKKLLTNST